MKSVFSVGDLVAWSVGRGKTGARPEGKVVKVLENYGYPGNTRYEVQATKEVTFKSTYDGSWITIKKGDILQPFELKRVK